MPRRALTHPRFGRGFGLLRRVTSSRRKHIALVRDLYRQMDMVEDGCLCCGKRDFSLLAECDRYGFDLQKQICESCGLVQTYPALSQSFLDVFYRDHYRRLYTKSDLVNYDHILAEQNERGERFHRFLLQELDAAQIAESHVVEIGCSAGGILAYFRDHAKSVQGCDLDEAAVRFGAAQFGLVLTAEAFPESLPEGSKIFILSHVLEHVAKPKELLAQIRAHMGPGDHLFIEVPGLNMVAEGEYSHNLRAYFHIAHVADYSAATLTAMLAQAGLAPLRCTEGVTGIFVRHEGPVPPIVRDPQDSVENVRRIERTFGSK